MDWDKLSEEAAVSDEHLLESFLEEGALKKEDLVDPIHERKVFPVFFGSALKNEGVQELLDGLETYVKPGHYPAAFGARVFKISRDDQGNRLTHVKITGGKLKVKDLLTNAKPSDDTDMKQSNDSIWNEKVDQIRIYSGKQYRLVQELEAGCICTLTGLTHTKSGDGLGYEQDEMKPSLKPVLSYRIVLPDGCNVNEMLKNLRQLEEEEPHLNVLWNEVLAEIHVQVMGEIEIEILRSLILDRYGVDVAFDSGNLVYKETIAEPVIGVGHFEPLRHYAEVHLLMEPGERGSGMTYDSSCSEDLLGRSWQRLVLTHLGERNHMGTLTGAELTDMKITVVAGRAHEKHTEGGDFRQATFRGYPSGTDAGPKGAARAGLCFQTGDAKCLSWKGDVGYPKDARAARGSGYGSRFCGAFRGGAGCHHDELCHGSECIYKGRGQALSECERL